MTKTYYIHDNGGRPFMVKIKKKNKSIDGDNKKEGVQKLVKVYRQLKDSEKYEERRILKFRPEKVFVGKSPLNWMTMITGGHGKPFDGNSMLLKISENKYVYIGSKIYSFKPYAQIKKYVSPVGGSDVPYPYAVDVDQNYYLMIEDVVLTNVPEDQMNDPYEYYYRKAGLITPDHNIQPLISNFQGISEFYIGNDRYTLRHRPSNLVGKEDYDRWRSQYNWGVGISVIKTDGKRYFLNRKQYINLMKDFEEELGFKVIKGKKILQARLW